MWTYRQSTGELIAADGVCCGVGYAGHGAGINDPAMDAIAHVGPLPRGRYTIGLAYDHPTLGPLTMNVAPDPATEMHGRADFRIHGDSIHDPGTASHGCMVQDHRVRRAVSESADRDLEVVA
jgi:hypothetical protein